MFIAKLKAYGFNNNSLKLAILGPLFFNIHLGDLSFIIDKFYIVNFANDNTPYVTGDNIPSVVKLLEEVACAIFQWFKDNEMKANAGKCHVLLNTRNVLTVKINAAQIKKITHMSRRWGTTQNFFFGFTDELEKQIFI